MANKTLKITLTRSPISTPSRHRDCVKALGLRRLNQSVLRDDTPVIRGLINKIYYLLTVEEVS